MPTLPRPRLIRGFYTPFSTQHCLAQGLCGSYRYCVPDLPHLLSSRSAELVVACESLCLRQLVWRQHPESDVQLILLTYSCCFAVLLVRRGCIARCCRASAGLIFSCCSSSCRGFLPRIAVGSSVPVCRRILRDQRFDQAYRSAGCDRGRRLFDCSRRCSRLLSQQARFAQRQVRPARRYRRCGFFHAPRRGVVPQYDDERLGPSSSQLLYSRLDAPQRGVRQRPLPLEDALSLD